jgi:hypothetical protein
VKINVKETKEVDKFVYLGSVVENSGKIQNKINERIEKASATGISVISILS